MWVWGENPANSPAASLLPCFGSLASTDKHLDVNYSIADILLHHYHNATQHNTTPHNTAARCIEQLEWLEGQLEPQSGWIWVGKRKRSKPESSMGRRECVCRENILTGTLPLLLISWQLNGTEPQQHQSLGTEEPRESIQHFNIFYSAGFILTVTGMSK